MPVVQQGQINATALVVPDLYVQIVPPQVALLNGVPTNVLGIVGTATWGPVNAPSIGGSMADYARIHGQIQNRKYDMGTQVAVAVLQGAANFRFVRVTDGTDLAATVVVQASCLTLTAKYTGTTGNALQATLGAGSQANTSRITLALPGYQPEVFDNIPGTGNALWVNMAAAINNGNGALRGKSDLVVATAGAGTAALAAATVTLAGGTDGVTSITSSVMLGVDTANRSGMYSLRNTGASIALLADLDDSTSWTTQVSFGLSEGIYMVGVGPAGETITNAASVKATAGIDSYAFKLLLGDWIYWLDTVNGLTRLVSPQGFVAGLMSNMSPEQSSLNKQLYGIVATQRTIQNRVYSGAELQVLGQAGIDVVTNPVPGGNYFGARFGHNTSSNAVTNGDNYTRMTNYIAYTLNAGMGKYVGKLQSVQKDDPTRSAAKATVDSFLAGMKQSTSGTGLGMIDDFSTICDLSNNSVARINTGYMQMDVKVKYLSVVEKFLINLEGGQSVQVARVSTATA
ncbi:tail protein [Herbaspirillum sp. YR522]|uniref:tail protein n=1 Tax=Herbaspirillum sp. YR522 TaxID=1144342 RepID=UPI00026FB348|nr:tail protein [Herbaspirillum sp. YR522]EJN07789.1 Phage tail sheath protein [Herbaspirillum sp. YR522]